MDQVRNVEEWLRRIGQSLRELRLQRNLGQVDLASQAGLGRSAVQNLESGHGTLETLVRAVRALGREDWLASLANQPTINPLHMTRQAQKRRRASSTRRGKPPAHR
jgi:transcriptional regulator with XRE-family HTH domain